MAKCKGIVSLILILLLLCGCSGSETFSVSQPKVAAEDFALHNNNQIITAANGTYEEVCRNDVHAFYVDTATGWFILEELATGKRWFSVPENVQDDEISTGTEYLEAYSQLVVGYLYREDESKTTASLYVGSDPGSYLEDGVSIELLSNGVRVIYYFPEYGFTIPVEYTLGDGYFSASVDVDSLDEGKLCYITEINLLPNFCGADWNAEGYLFVPDGSGALANLNDNEEAYSYEQRVYGTAEIPSVTEKHKISETVRLPVFGISVGNNSLMGIIEDAAAASSLVAKTRGENNGYNTISAKLLLRNISQKTMFETEESRQLYCSVSDMDPTIKRFSVRYYTLSGEDSSWNGMARRYREYLFENKSLEKQDTTPCLNVKLYGAIEQKKIFAGIAYTGMTALTSYDQVEKIAEELIEGGVNNLNISYSGWMKSGVVNREIPSKALPCGVLGGKKQWNDLVGYLDENNIGFYPEAELLTLQNTNFSYQLNRDTVRNVFADRLPIYSYNAATMQYDLATRAVYKLNAAAAQRAYHEFLNSYKKLSVDKVLLSGITNELYNSLYADKYYGSEATALTYEKIISEYSEQLNIASASPNAYAMVYSDRIFDVPTSSSGYDFLDLDVPFYSMVLHGVVPMSSASLSQSSDPRHNFLKAVEYGLELSYDGMYCESDFLADTTYNHLYSTGYELWSAMAIENYNDYYSILQNIAEHEMLDNREVSKGVCCSVYSNGQGIYVNYNSVDVTVDGITVPALGFISVEVEQ